MNCVTKNQYRLLALASVLTLLSGMVYAHAGEDRRLKLYDISKLRHKNRVQRSDIIQFYSSYDNIGNYTPVLGIQDMLDCKPDLWCMHKKRINFDFINKRYKCAIIGGAGLLHKVFEKFWQKLSTECTIPLIIWGVGICQPPQNRDGVDKKLVQKVANRCSLVNVRDDLTAQYYNLNNPSITACPTLVYLQKFTKVANPNLVLYSSRSEMETFEHEDKKIIDTIKQKIGVGVCITDNKQRPNHGLEDIIRDYYCKSRLVITTRLHGAIIAYGLGIPYIAIGFDPKLDAFVERYGNGVIAHTTQELVKCIDTYEQIKLKPIALEPVLDFGQQAKKWITRNTMRQGHKR